MTRIYLQVPFAEKDQAKQLGARWDAERKLWYVPNGLDASSFEEWLPSEPSFNVLSNYYFIAQAVKQCWKCGEFTNVYGFILPPSHVALETDEDDREILRQSDEPAIVYYIADLLPSVVKQIKAFTHDYYVDFSQTTESSYWMNHCEHCNMKQGDFQMYCEPQGAFCPMDAQAAELITLHKINEPFACDGSAAYHHYIFEYM